MKYLGGSPSLLAEIAYIDHALKDTWNKVGLDNAVHSLHRLIFMTNGLTYLVKRVTCFYKQDPTGMGSLFCLFLHLILKQEIRRAFK